MKLQVRKIGKVNVFEMAGKMVIGEGDVHLRETIQELLEQGERFFILDMVGVYWLDSGSVGEVVACRKRVYERKGEIRLILQGKAHDVFTTTALDKVFHISPDLESALASFVG